MAGVGLAVGLAGCVPQVRHAPDPSATSTPVGPTAAQVAAGLRHLPFDAFLSASSDALLARSPQRVTALGAAERLGMGNDRLDDLSPEYEADTHALERAVLDLLRGYDRVALPATERLSYDVYEWYLDDLVRGQRFAGHDYPITQCRIGYHSRLVSLLTLDHPMETPADAEDYLARLGRVDGQVQQLLAGMRRRQAAGVVLPRFIVTRSAELLEEFLGTHSRDPEDVDPSSLSLYTSFSDRLEGIAGLNPAARQALRERALAAVSSSVVPATMAQLTYLDELAGVATDDAGVWKLPDGDAYYAWRLRSQSTADVTPDQAHEMGLREVAAARSDLRQALTDLGFPADVDLMEAAAQAVDDAGYLSLDTPSDQQAVVQAWEALVRDAEDGAADAFGLWPSSEVRVIGGLGGEFYEPAASGSEPCEFHVGISAPNQARYMMRTVAYHEAVPGHHTQIGVARDLDLPQFRRDLTFPAFSEGWAVYAERLAWEQGLYDGDPYGNIGRLLCDLLRAARLVTDTGIHARRWTREQAIAYMNETAGAVAGTFDDEVDRMVVAPAAAVGNEIAMLQILDMRSRASDALGERFALRGFHDAVLGGGSVPVAILSGAVDRYVGGTAPGGDS